MHGRGIFERFLGCVNDFVQGIFYNPEDCGSYVTCNSDNEGGIKVGLGLKHTKNICFMVYNLI